MRILVLSDSHGRVSNLVDIIEKHRDINNIIFLGDGADDMDSIAFMLGKKNVMRVCGNCDFSCYDPYSKVEKIGSKKIYMTHGHMEHVKSGLYELKAKARRENADIALFGHTHEQYSEYDDGLYIFNPGTAGSGRYGIIDIADSGIIMNEMKLW